MSSKLPPQSVEAEELILGGILFDPRAISKVADILKSEVFYVSSHRHIYQAALELYQKNQPTDLMTVSNWLSDHNQLEKVGGMSRLAQLIERTVSAANIDRYAAIIINKYQRRRLISASKEIEELGFDTTLELEEVLQESEAKIFSITVNKRERFQPKYIRDCLADVIEQMQENISPSYKTGLTDLDALIGGLTRKNLIVVAARASMGKTWFGCYLANQIAQQYQLPVIFFSAEMSREELTKRFLAMHSGIDSARLRESLIYEDEWDNFVNGIESLSKMPIIIDDTPGEYQSPAKMRSLIRRVISEKGQIGLVVFDYIQALSEQSGDRSNGTRAQEVGKYSRAFKAIAKEFDVPVVALAQINRSVEGQTNKRPLMSQIRDSGEVEQDMDLGLALYRDEYYHPDTADKGLMEIIVLKNRNGATGMCKVQVETSTGSCLNLKN